MPFLWFSGSQKYDVKKIRIKVCTSYTDRYICHMKFTPRSENTRQLIIERTAGIFNKKGYAGTALSDLTEATNLTKGSIYGNFENKEDVALAAFDYNIACRVKIVRDRISRYSSNKERLMVYATIFSSQEEYVFPEGGCPLLNAGTEADDTHEPLRQRVSEALLLWKKDIQDIIQQGVISNEFRQDVDANRIALSIIALIEGGILIGRSTQNPLYQDTIMETVRELIKSIYNN